ncbi:MAG: tyrosine-type recombinase/integrase [Bacteroidales bacterium]|nr:tyrosine-type recombinase/integrase [Bacteroidales bacterium]
MPTVFKVVSTVPLPAGAEIVERDGKPHYKKLVKGRPKYYPLSANGRGYLRESPTWCYKIAGKRYTGYRDKQATEQKAADHQRRAERKQAGLVDPSEEPVQRPIAEHLADYATYLTAKGSGAAHVNKTLSRIRAVVDDSGAGTLSELDSVRVSEWLHAQRQNSKPTPIPPGESFTPGEAARILGMSSTGLAKWIKAHNLPATGNGKARRLPRVTLEVIAGSQAVGMSPATVNHHIVALKAFCNWLVKVNRLAVNPLGLLSKVRESADVRHARRELTVDELVQLLAAARESNRVFRGLSGEDRYWLYLVAAGTGFRANALANLTRAEFDSTAGTVMLPARFSKNGKSQTNPLPADVIEPIGDYLAGKPTTGPIWPGTWSEHAAEMLRGDLETAGIPYKVETSDGPKYADFHSLRHTFVTLLGIRGADPRTLQALAGHSTPILTARYSHRGAADKAAAVNLLPNLTGGTPEGDHSADR